MSGGPIDETTNRKGGKVMKNLNLVKKSGGRRKRIADSHMIDNTVLLYA